METSYLGRLSEQSRQTKHVLPLAGGQQRIVHVSRSARREDTQLHLIRIFDVESQGRIVSVFIDQQRIRHYPQDTDYDQQFGKYPAVAAALVPDYFQYMLYHLPFVFISLHLFGFFAFQ